MPMSEETFSWLYGARTGYVLCWYCREPMSLNQRIQRDEILRVTQRDDECDCCWGKRRYRLCYSDSLGEM